MSPVRQVGERRALQNAENKSRANQGAEEPSVSTFSRINFLVYAVPKRHT
jgi:hypothetical protein